MTVFEDEDHTSEEYMRLETVRTSQGMISEDQRLMSAEDDDTRSAFRTLTP